MQKVFLVQRLMQAFIVCLQWKRLLIGRRGFQKSFFFCPKMSRYLTHMKKLHDPEEPLERFFEIFKPMNKQMGPVLIQLPKMVKFNDDVAEHFFMLLASKYRK